LGIHFLGQLPTYRLRARWHSSCHDQTSLHDPGI
jgi:hypothetical protein